MGEIVGGRYELLDALASGDAGTVWRVWDHREHAYFAAKVLRQSDSDSLLRVVRETTRQVDHPHVIAPYGWIGEDDQVPFTMPLIEAAPWTPSSATSGRSRRAGPSSSPGRR